VKAIPKQNTSLSLGFVESAGMNNYVYIVWEEGSGDAENGLSDAAQIYLAKLKNTGEIESLSKPAVSTKIAQTELSNTFQTYPNPFSNELSVTYSGHQRFIKFELFDLTGVCISSFLNPSNEKTIKLAGLPQQKGLYLLIATEESGQKTITKVMKV